MCVHPSTPGAGQTEAITQALHAMVAPHLSGDESSTSQVTPVLDAASTSLQTVSAQGNGAEISPPNDIARSQQSYVFPMTPAMEMSPEQILTMIREALCEEVVAKVQETFQVEISGAGAGTYFLDLRNGQCMPISPYKN